MSTVSASDALGVDPGEAASAASGDTSEPTRENRLMAVALFAPRQIRRAAVGTKNFVVDHKRGILGGIGVILAIGFVVASCYISYQFLVFLYATHQTLFWVAVAYYAAIFLMSFAASVRRTRWAVTGNFA